MPGTLETGEEVEHWLQADAVSPAVGFLVCGRKLLPCFDRMAAICGIRFGDSEMRQWFGACDACLAAMAAGLGCAATRSQVCCCWERAPLADRVGQVVVPAGQSSCGEEDLPVG
jgi:hypothetical protein